MDDIRLIDSRTGEYIGDYNDFSFEYKDDLNGLDLKIVNKSDRVKQDLVKILLTPYSIRPYVNYGSLLPSIKDVRLSDSSLADTVSDDIISSISYLSSIETSTDEEEQIANISKLEVEVLFNRMIINLIVATVSGYQLKLNFEV